MGNFANTLFSVLLGWVQSATAWLWSLITSDGADGLMGWVLDNWLLLAIGLCLLGLAVDGIVYLIRWQPYRVWRSFLRGDEPEEQPEPPVEEEPLQWLYATGEVASGPGPVQAYPPAEAEQIPARRQRVIPARRSTQAAGREGAEQQGYHQPYYPPQWDGGRRQGNGGGTQE